MLARLTACLALAALSTPVAAEDSNVFQLGDIEVTAKRIHEEGAGVETVEQQQMQDFNRETVSRALNLEPGITLGNVGQRNESVVHVRGFDLRQVPVYVDGIPVYVPYDGYVDLGRFNTFDLSQIEVTKGFSSVLNGPNNFGGAINLISRRPVGKLEGDVGTGIYLDDDFRDNGYNAYANFGTNQGLWYAQLGISQLYKRQWSLSDDFVQATPNQAPGERENSYNEDTKVNLKLGYTPNATDEYSINLIYQRGEKGTPPYANDPTAFGLPNVPVRFWQWPHWDKTSAYWISQTAIDDTSYIKTRIYYDEFENSLYSYDDATYTTISRPFAFRSWYDDYSYGASAEYGRKLAASNDLKLALHYKYDVHREHNEGEPTRRIEDQIYSLALEDSQHFGDRWTVVAGISYDVSDTKEAQNFVGGVVVPFQTGDADALNPQIGVFYKTTDTGIVRATVSHKTRFPTIKDRFSYRMGTADPNPDLKPETVTHYEIGYSEQFAEKVRVNGAVFYSDIRDLIQLVTAGAPSGLNQQQNIGKVENRGFELAVSYFPTSALELGANYTYLDRDNKTPDQDILLTDVPMHKALAYAQWRFVERLRLIGLVEYNSDRFSDTAHLDRVADEFTVVNAKVVWSIAGGFEAEAGVNNLTDENYEYVEGFPEEGRNYFMNVRYRF